MLVLLRVLPARLIAVFVCPLVVLFVVGVPCPGLGRACTLPHIDCPLRWRVSEYGAGVVVHALCPR